jgi:putative two-component system response regulator
MNANEKTDVHVLVVDDERSIRSLVEIVVGKMGLECTVAGDGIEALEVLNKRKVDVVITDIDMPRLNGIQLISAIREKYDSDIIVMTGFIEDYSYSELIADGASDFMEKPINVKELMIRLRRILKEREMIAARNQAEAELKQSWLQVRKSLEGTIDALGRTMEIRDAYTYGHQKRVRRLACEIAGEMNLTQDQQDGLRLAGIVHDIGKISIPSEILSKPGQLTEIEYQLIKIHPESGYDILKDIEFTHPVAEIVLQHHERINGSGYPKGLKGAEILLEARVLAVADVVEAMASHRPYRPAKGIDAALEEIEKTKGGLYDPGVVDACLRLFHEKGYVLS